MGNIAGSLALGLEDAIGYFLLAGALSHRYGGDFGAGGDDLVGSEGLGAFEQLFGNFCIAGCVEGEELIGGFFGDDTAVVWLERWIFQAELFCSPCDDLVSQFFKTFLHIGDVDIFAPRLLAFPGGLLVLLRGAWRHRCWAGDGHLCECW